MPAKKPKVLVTGAAGMVGSRIVKKLKQAKYRVCATSHRHTLSDPEISFQAVNLGDARSSFELIHAFNPDVVVHTAAMTNIDICELYQEQAFLANVLSVKNLIGLALLFGYRLIFFSSEQVYGEHPGGKKLLFTEDDNRKPLSFYGHSKKIAEDEIMRHLSDFVILRLSLVYGWGSERHPNWCDLLYEDLEEGIERKMYKDQRRSMIFADDIPVIVEKIVRQKAVSGVFNLGGNEPVIRSNFAKDFATNWGFSKKLVRMVSMDDEIPESPRPKNCALDLSKIKKRIKFEPTLITNAFEQMKIKNPHKATG